LSHIVSDDQCLWVSSIQFYDVIFNIVDGCVVFIFTELVSFKS